MGPQHHDGLTGPSTESKKRSHHMTTRKRKPAAEFASNAASDGAHSMTGSSNGRQRKRRAVDYTLQLEDNKHEDSPKKSKKPARKPDEEKRSRVFRKRPPQSYSETLNRALIQRMFVIDRTRAGTDACPEESVDIAGTTGNIYTVHIGKEPYCTCPHAKKGNQCKHIVYVLVRVLKAPPRLQYQLAFLTSELREIFAQAPPVPSANASSNGDRIRKPVEDDCPICCMEFEPEKEDIVYCKTACGNNIHKECFEQWAASKRASGAGITCPFCRSLWMEDEDMVKNVAKTGAVNAEGYRNVAGQLGISGRRDYSTYHPFWVRRQALDGVDVGDCDF